MKKKTNRNKLLMLMMMSVFVLGTITSCGRPVSQSSESGNSNLEESPQSSLENSSDSTASSSEPSTIASTTSNSTSSILSSSSTTSSTFANSNSTESESISDVYDGNYILDLGFTGGVTVINPIKPPVTISGKFDFGNNIEGKITYWWLTQWNSLNNIARTAGKKNGDRYEYVNPNKTVALSDDGTITLRINASLDYLEARTTPQDPWAHLYLEQRYTQQRNFGKFKKVYVTYNFVIPFCDNKMSAEVYDPNIHASIAVFYLTLGDVNPSSPGYGDFINFCMPLFDNRVDIPQKSWFMDSGTDPNAVTNKMIYTMDGNLLYDSPTGNGKWHSVNLDIMPYIKESFNLAKNNGCMKQTNFSDVGLRSFFFGFENPGMIDTELQIKDMSIRVE